MPRDTETMAAELSLGTFNLRNLQGPGLPRYPNSTPYSEAFYRRKIRWTGDRVKDLAADLLGVQELWSRQALIEALDRVNLDDDYEAIAGPDAADTGRIHNALAVKKPHRLIDFEYITDLPDELVLKKAAGSGVDSGLQIDVDTSKFSRPVLVATVQPVSDDGDDLPEIKVVVSHLKSKRPMELGPEVLSTPGLIPPDKTAIGSALSMIKRTTEAAGIRLLVSRLQRDDPDDDGPGRPVIVLGDLNSAQHSVPLTIMTTQPAYRLEAGSRTVAAQATVCREEFTSPSAPLTP